MPFWALAVRRPSPPPFAGQERQVIIWGGWLIGATEVTFNGVPAASFKVTSSQSIIATVPEGASTGPIAVTTPGGMFTTTANFTVN